MIDSAISCDPLNTSLYIQSLQFTNALCSNIPRKQINNFKHAILWNTPSTLIYEARQARQFYEALQARHFMKHAKFRITPSTSFHEARQVRKHAKHAST